MLTTASIDKSNRFCGDIPVGRSTVIGIPVLCIVYPAKVHEGVVEAEMLLKMSKKTEIGRRIKNKNRFIHQ